MGFTFTTSRNPPSAIRPLFPTESPPKPSIKCAFDGKDVIPDVRRHSNDFHFTIFIL
jgi:hypothetical protein